MSKKPELDGGITVTNDEKTIVITSKVNIEARGFVLFLGVLDGQKKPTAIATPLTVELEKPKKEVRFENWPAQLKLTASHPRQDTHYILEVYMLRQSGDPIPIQSFAYPAEVLAQTIGGIEKPPVVETVALKKKRKPRSSAAPAKKLAPDSEVKTIQTWLVHITDTANRMKVHRQPTIDETVANGLKRIKEEITGLKENFQDPRLDELTKKVTALNAHHEQMIKQQNEFEQRQREKTGDQPNPATKTTSTTQQGDNMPENKPEIGQTFSAEQVQKMMEDTARKAASEAIAEMKAQQGKQERVVDITAQTTDGATNRNADNPSLWQSATGGLRRNWKVAWVILVTLIALILVVWNGWNTGKKVASFFKTPSSESETSNIPITPANDPARNIMVGVPTNSLPNLPVTNVVIQGMKAPETPKSSGRPTQKIKLENSDGNIIINTDGDVSIYGDRKPYSSKSTETVNTPPSPKPKARKTEEVNAKPVRRVNITPAPNLRRGESDNIVVEVEPFGYVECVYTHMDKFEYNGYIRRQCSVTGKFETMPPENYRSEQEGNMRWFKNNSSDKLVIGFKCTKI